MAKPGNDPEEAAIVAGKPNFRVTSLKRLVFPSLKIHTATHILSLLSWIYRYVWSPIHWLVAVDHVDAKVRISRSNVGLTDRSQISPVSAIPWHLSTLMSNVDEALSDKDAFWATSELFSFVDGLPNEHNSPVFRVSQPSPSRAGCIEWA